MPTRKQVMDKISSLEILKERFDYYRDDFIRLSGKKEFEKTDKYYDGIISKLTKEMYLMPIRHRYTGTFYLKIPYTVPAEYEKLKGSVYMQEHLVSWEVEEPKLERYQNYYRAVYKKPEAGAEMMRDDAEAVYEMSDA